MTSIVAAVRRGALDAELATLAWLLAVDRVPVHVVGPSAGEVADLAAAVRSVAAEPASVTEGAGSSVEEVLRQPVPLRPATGVVLVLDGDGRVAVAHFLRAPLRDAGGHVRSQAPAVLAAWDAGLGEWEHFAWGVLPELAAASSRRAGDLEIELGRRREFVQALVAAEVDDERVAAALAGYGFGARR